MLKIKGASTMNFYRIFGKATTFNKIFLQKFLNCRIGKQQI